MNLEVIFVNGTKLNPENITDTQVNLNGATRRAMEFMFSDEAYSLSQLEDVFTPANCERIVIADHGVPGAEVQTNVRDGYIVMGGIRTESRMVTPGDEENAPEYATFKLAVVAKRTYEENQMSALQAGVDAALLLALGAAE